VIRLILMRHGNTFEKGETPVQVGARTDLPLTAVGQEHAQAMAQHFISQGIFPKAIFAGSLKRQTESARIIAQSLGLSFLDEPALTEIDYGVWEGLSAEQITRQWPKEHAEWEAGKWQEAIFGGTEEEYMRPIQDWLGRLRKTFRDNDVVLGVTSNGLLRRFQNEKVKTGHYCEIDLFEDRLVVQKWNIYPT